MPSLAEIKSYTKDMLVPQEVAPVLGVNPYSINVQAHSDPTKLGFPVVVIGRRIKIPRLPFIEFMERGGSANNPERLGSPDDSKKDNLAG